MAKKKTETPDALQSIEANDPFATQPVDPSIFNDAGSLELGDGTYFKVQRLNAVEAQLTEAVVKDGGVIAHTEQVDVARIILGKLMRRIGEIYGN